MGDAAIHLLVGTTKGAFVIDGDADRTRWSVRGPYCDGWPINHVVGDPLTGTMWAGGGGDWSGAGVWRSSMGVSRVRRATRSCASSGTASSTSSSPPR